MKSTLRLIAVLAVSVFVFGSAVAAEEKFPSKPITFIVPYPPGGSNDTFARAIGKQMSESLGQPVVVENRPGAGGSVGAAATAKAKPDGYTILIVSSSFSGSAAIQTKLPYDPVRDFTPVARIAMGPFVLTVRNSLEAKTTHELIALAKKNPGKLNYASSGSGSINQFATEEFAQLTGIKMTHVPYKGMGPATNDLIGGHVDVLFASATSIMQQVKAGNVRALGVSSLKPTDIAPGLPALAESGAPGYSFALGWGVLAPANTPKDRVARLNREINKALASAEIKKFLANEGAEPAPMQPEEFTKYIHDDIANLKKLAKAANIQAE